MSARGLCVATLCVSLGLGVGQAAAGGLDLRAGTAVDAVPDIDGAARIRLRNDIWLHARLHPRWSVFAAGNLRFGWRLSNDVDPDRPKYAGEGIDEADLYRLGLRYSAPDLSLNLGRFVRPAVGGLYRVDGVAAEIGADSLPVGVEVWFGRLGHPEPLTPVSSLGGGVELRLTPPGAHGLGWSGAAIRVGYDFDKSVYGLRHRVHATGSYRNGAGSSVAGGAEIGLLPAPADEAAGELETGARAWFRGVATPNHDVEVSGEFRWEGLPAPSVPESSAEVLRTLVPQGYAVAQVAVELRLAGPRLRIAGGPTVLPHEGGPRGGGTGKVWLEVALAHGSVGVFGTGTAVGGSSYAGGGSDISGRLGPVRLRGDLGLYRFAGLDGQVGLVGEGRFDADVLVPFPKARSPLGGDLRIAVHVAGGADRLLAPWVRAGLAVRIALSATRGGGS